MTIDDRQPTSVIKFAALFAAMVLAIPVAIRAASPSWPVLSISVLGQNPPKPKSLLEDEEEPPLGVSPTAKSSQPNENTPKADALPSPDSPPGAPTVSISGGRLNDLFPSLSEAGSADKQPLVGEPACDLLRYLPNRGEARERYVRLIPSVLQRPFNSGERYAFTCVEPGSKSRIVIEPLGAEIVDIRYYEERMLQRAAQEFGVSVERLSSSKPLDLAIVDERAAARCAALLQAAIAEHDSAIERKLRHSQDNGRLREPLALALRNVLLAQIRVMLQQGRAEQSFSACDRLLSQPARASAAENGLRGQLRELMLVPAEEAAKMQDYPACQQQLTEYLRRFRNDPSERSGAIRSKLVEVAESYLQRAQKEKDLALLDQAASIWPSLRGLEQARSSIHAEYPVLHCGYSVLPRHLSPLSARTPVEIHATSLLFEGLVRWTDDRQTGARYVPQMCQWRPLPLARGRQFQLPAQCLWSDSQTDRPHLCTAEDVVCTISLLRKTHPSGFSSAWSQLVRGVDTSKKEHDPFVFDILLERDHWQPLSLMDFMVLPSSSFPRGGDAQELAQFDENPVGTGPFTLLDRNEKQVRFGANSFYRQPGHPLIREVRFHQLDSIEGSDAIRNNKIQLLYGVRPTHADELTKQGQRVIKLAARSVCFLAPNYNNAALGNRDLRLAIANAIDRESILTSCFRPGQSGRDHAALSGPYLTDSWAFNAGAPKFSVAQAATYAARAKETLGELPKLRLTYPDRDPDVGAACGEIKRQFAAVGIEVSLQPSDPQRFFENIVGLRQFDLAYWEHFYEDETYWIWPLFDPSDRGSSGANFMHISPDKSLADLFHQVLLHKQFTQIQSATWKIHDHIARNAPIIPLWQLNPYVALSSALEIPDPTLDPIQLFSGVERWTVKQTSK